MVDGTSDGNGAMSPLEEVAERTAAGGPVADDDLQRIRGVGPKLESLLKGLGITSFRQVARLQPDDIAVVGAELGRFQSRIERDNWMASAAQLHEETYGEPV